jgi:hypothetical protein
MACGEPVTLKPSDEPDGIRLRWFRRWRIWAMFAIAFLLISGAVWWIRLSSDGDLRAIRAAARDLAIATSAEEMGDVLAAPDRLAQWNRLAVLAKGLKSYSSANLGASSYIPLKLFEAVPAAMRAHHAALDAAKMDEVLHLIDALGADPLVLRTEYSITSMQPEIGTLRGLANLLKERLALADPDDVEIEARRLLTLCLAYDTKNLLSILVKTSITEIAWSGLTRRLVELRRPGSGIPALVDRCSACLAEDFKRGLEGEFVSFLDYLEHPQPAGAWTLFSLSGISPPNPWDSMLNSVDVSLGRESLLQLELDWAQRARTTADPYRLLQLAKASTTDYKGVQLGMMRKHLASMVAPVYEMVIPMVFATILHGRLLSAELRGERWPTDDFDPTHPVLRSVVRDGAVCGAYSLNAGSDDRHGQKPNRYFALYGPLDPPKPPPAQKP